MIRCFHNTEEGKHLISKMVYDFGISEESATHIADVSGTSLDITPDGKPSKLFSKLIDIFGNRQQAALAKAVCYSDEFLDKFGDWIKDKTSTAALDINGEPEIVWTSVYNKKVNIPFSSSFTTAIANALKIYFEERGEYVEGVKYAIENMMFCGRIQLKIANGIPLTKEETRLLTGRTVASKASINNNLIKKLLFFYDSFRNDIKRANIQLMPAFISPKEKNKNGNYIVSDYTKVRRILNSSLPIEQMFPESITRAKETIYKIKDPYFTIGGQKFKLKDNITFDKIDILFRTEDRFGISNKEWEDFKINNQLFVKRLQLDPNILSHFLFNFYNNKLSRMDIISGNGSEVNRISLIDAMKTTLLLDDPTYGTAKYLIATSPNVRPYKIYNWQDKFNNIFGNAVEVTAKDALLRIAVNKSEFSELAKYLKEYAPNIKIILQDNYIKDDFGKDHGGVYNGDKILISRRSRRLPESVILHEIFHAITYNQLRTNTEWSQEAHALFNKAQTLIFKKYNVNNYEELKEKIGEYAAYGFSTSDEFFSSIWTNSAFVKELNSIGTKKKSIWLGVKEFIARIFGLEETSDLYLRATELLDEIIKNPIQQKLVDFNEDISNEIFEKIYVDDLHKLYDIEVNDAGVDEFSAGYFGLYTSEMNIPTASYGVVIDTNIIKNWQNWKKENPTGIIAYRTSKNQYTNPTYVEENNVIGNPFDWEKYGTGNATQMFFAWLVTGKNYDEPNATEELRQVFIEKILEAEPNTPILYYKELGRPSHATMIGYLINNKELLKNPILGWARYSDNGYEVSSAGDDRFSASNAKFKLGTIIDGVDVGGKTIEEVYQTIIKKSSKGEAPSKESKLSISSRELNLSKQDKEDFSYYVGYLPLWQEWARQNPDLIRDLKIKAKRRFLTDKFATTKVSLARALADILNGTDEQKAYGIFENLITLHSGGAIGSDSVWDEIGLKYGVQRRIHYHHEDKPSTALKNTRISEEDFERGKQLVEAANKYLNRRPSQYMNLFSRSAINADKADSIFAIGKLLGTKMPDGRIIGGIVDGGTGWAVEVGLMQNKPVYVFSDGLWYKGVYELHIFTPLDGIPVLTPNFAGIGTRQITEDGRKAIERVYNKSRSFINDDADYIIDFGNGNLSEDLKNVAEIWGLPYVKAEDIKEPISGKVTVLKHNAIPDSKIFNFFKKQFGIKNPQIEIKTYSELRGGSQEEINAEKEQFAKELENSIEEVAVEEINAPIKFNKEQSIAIKGIVNAYKNKGRGQVITCITGKAGTGKTTVIGQIVKMIDDQIQDGSSLRVICGAVSNEAKKNLYTKMLDFLPSSVHLDAKSVAGMLGKKPVKTNTGDVKFAIDLKSRQIAEKSMALADIVIVDEVSMVDKESLEDIESLATNALIIYAGDISQIKPIDETSEIPSGFTRAIENNTFKLIERVRQGEGSAVLDYADLFGDVASKKYTEITELDKSKYKEGLIQKQSIELDTNALYLVNTQNIINTIYPAIKKAIELDDPNYFHIIPFHIEARKQYNDIIRTLLLNEKFGQELYSIDRTAENYIGKVPYEEGEWLLLNDAFLLEDTILDNGTKLKVIDSKASIDDHNIPVFIVTCLYKNLNNETLEVTLKIVQPTDYAENLYRNTIRELANKIASMPESYEKKAMWRQYYIFKESFANASLAWALNIHKAQGQTYQIGYIPLDDYITHINEILRGGKIPVSKAYVDSASELYTAVTRNANITIVGSSAWKGDVDRNIVDVNEQITNNRKKSAERTTIEKISEDVGNKVNLDVSKKPMSKKLKWIYDFTKFVTGSDLLFLGLRDKTNQEILSRLRSQFFQREAELEKMGRTFGPIIYKENGDIDFETIIKDPKVLRKPMNEKTAQNYPKISKLTVKPALIITPQLNAHTYKLGNRTLAEIDLNFFKSKNSFYRTDAQDIDLLVRTHIGQINIVFAESLEASKNLKYGKPVNVTLNSEKYRLDVNGNRMYKISDDSQLYRDERGNEVLIIKKDGDIVSKTQDFLDTISDIISIQPFLTNMNLLDTVKEFIQISQDYSSISVINKQLNEISRKEDLKQIKEDLYKVYDERRNEKAYENLLSKTLFNSFVKSLEITASRIPTQALASFMNMVIAAYNPSGANDVFVSRWQLWLLGSDLDIDKVFIMGFGINSKGNVEHWSRIADYSSAERAEISDELPIPSGERVVINDRAKLYSKYTDSLIFVDNKNKDFELTYLIEHFYDTFDMQNGKTERLRIVKDILKYMNAHNTFSVSQEVINNPNFLYLIRNYINKHNLSKISETAAKNLAIRRIQSVCSDVRNIQSAHSPIDRATGKLTSYLSKLPGRKGGSAYDGISIYKLQEDNLTGKAVVGVMANALKAYLSMTQYFNLYYKNNDNVTGLPYFFNHFELNGKSYDISTLSNVRITDEQFQEIVKASLELSGVSDKEFKLVETEEDVSIILSAFTTLATDNAKMLALAKMRASLNLASMHCYLAMFGVPFSDIINYTTSPLFTDLYELTKANGYIGKDGTVTDTVWKELGERAKKGKDYNSSDVEQLHRLYNLAQELRTFTSLLGINGGIKSQVESAIKMKNTFETVYEQQMRRLNINESTEALAIELCNLHGLNPSGNALQMFKDKINNLAPFLLKYDLNLFKIKVDMNKYFNDAEYRRGVVLAYDLIKGTVNVFDIINHLPHFYEMLKSFNTYLLKMKASAKSEFVLFLAEKLFKPENINNYDGELMQRMYKLDYNFSDFVIRRIQRFYDDYIVSDFIKDKIAPITKISYLKNEKLYRVDLDTLNGLDLFKDLTFSIIAKLKTIEKNNEFLKSLIFVTNENNETGELELSMLMNFNLDSLTKKNSEADVLKYNLIVGGFNQIMNYEISKLLDDYENTSGYNLTVGDILYLYNTIFNLDAPGQNTLSSLFGKYIISERIDGKTSIPLLKFEIEKEYELRNRKLVPKEDLFNYYIFRNRIPKRLNGKMNYNGNIIQVNSPLINLNTVTDNSYVFKAFEQFRKAIRDNILNIYIGKC